MCTKSWVNITIESQLVHCPWDHEANGQCLHHWPAFRVCVIHIPDLISGLHDLTLPGVAGVISEDHSQLLLIKNDVVLRNWNILECSFLHLFDELKEKFPYFYSCRNVRFPHDILTENVYTLKISFLHGYENTHMMVQVPYLLWTMIYM